MFLRYFMGKYNEKYFKDDGMSSNKIEDLVGADEQILWRGKPKKSAFIWSKICTMLPIAIIWALFDGGFIYMLSTTGAFSSMPTFLVVFIILFFLIHLLPVWLWLSNVITAWAQYKNIEYAFTNKRIIVRTGILIDIKNIYYMDIESVNLRVGLIDRMLKVGDIYIKTKTEAVVLYDITNPYFITNQLQKIINDIKVDMNFPNALRPEENQGFNTKYSADVDFNNDKNKN